MVGVARRRGVARKVFSAGEDAGSAQRRVEDAGILHDLLGGRSIAPAPERIVRLFVEGDVEDGAEIEIETENPQELSGQFAVAGDEFRITLLAELSCVRRFVAKELEAGDTPPFLIDRDDWLDVAEFTESVCQSTQLDRGADVPAEEYESTGLYPADEVLVRRVDLGAGNAEEQKLTG